MLIFISNYFFWLLTLYFELKNELLEGVSGNLDCLGVLVWFGEVGEEK